MKLTRLDRENCSIGAIAETEFGNEMGGFIYRMFLHKQQENVLENDLR